MRWRRRTATSRRPIRWWRKLLDGHPPRRPRQGVIEPLTGQLQRAAAARSSSRRRALTRYPTVRLDYNLSPAHRSERLVRASTTWCRGRTRPTRGRRSSRASRSSARRSRDRYVFQTSLRSTLSSNLVNEVRYGMSGGATHVLAGPDAGHVQGPARQPGRLRARHQRRRHPQRRRRAAASARVKRRRSSSTRAELAARRAQRQPGRDLHAGRRVAAHRHARRRRSTSACRPATRRSAMFNADELPGQLDGAAERRARTCTRSLTGRISSISGTARLDRRDRPVRLQRRQPPGRPAARDRLLRPGQLEGRPNLSLNVGLRYALQLPFYSKDNSYSTATLDDAWGISGYVPGCNPSDADAGRPATCSSRASRRASSRPTRTSARA